MRQRYLSCIIYRLIRFLFIFFMGFFLSLMDLQGQIKEKDKHLLKCKLILSKEKVTLEEDDIGSVSGIIILKNISRKRLEFKHSNSDFRIFFDIKITNNKGEEFSDCRYGDFFFCPFGEERNEILEPGQRYFDHISPFATFKKKRNSGNFWVKAIFQYKNIKVESNSVKIKIEEKNKTKKG